MFLIRETKWTDAIAMSHNPATCSVMDPKCTTNLRHGVQGWNFTQSWKDTS